MGDQRQTTYPTYLRVYNGLQFNKLRGKLLCATFRGEVVCLVLIGHLQEEDLRDLADYLSMWRVNDYRQIYFQLDRRLETVELRTTLAGCGVELVSAEGQLDALATAYVDSVATPQFSMAQDRPSEAEIHPEPLPVG